MIWWELLGLEALIWLLAFRISLRLTFLEELRQRIDDAEWLVKNVPPPHPWRTVMLTWVQLLHTLLISVLFPILFLLLLGRVGWLAIKWSGGHP